MSEWMAIALGLCASLALAFMLFVRWARSFSHSTGNTFEWFCCVGGRLYEKLRFTVAVNVSIKDDGLLITSPGFLGRLLKEERRITWRDIVSIRRLSWGEAADWDRGRRAEDFEKWMAKGRSEAYTGAHNCVEIELGEGEHGADVILLMCVFYGRDQILNATTDTSRLLELVTQELESARSL